MIFRKAVCRGAARFYRGAARTVTGRAVATAAVVAAMCFTSCQKQPQLQKIGGFAQGSYYAVSYFTDQPGRNAAESLQPQIDSILEAFDLCASLWNENSEICRVNRNEDFEFSDMFCDMFEKSQSVSCFTQGAFDITVSPLVKRYGFSKAAHGEKGADSAARMLSEGELSEILAYVGYEKVRIENRRIVKDHPAVQLDFNAIAQGYAAGIVAEFLQSRGIKSYLVDVGGEITSQGTKPDGRAWIVGIEQPAEHAESDRTVLQRMTLQNQSLVTSGSYRKYFEENGVRYSHTINPSTGLPVRHNLLSATVLCTECWEADALATACMVWGLDDAKKFFENNAAKYQGFLIYSAPDGSLQQWHTADFPILPNP